MLCIFNLNINRFLHVQITPLIAAYFLTFAFSATYISNSLSDNLFRYVHLSMSVVITNNDNTV